MTVTPPGDSGFLAWNRPSLGEEEITEVIGALRSGWLTAGPKAARLECDVAAMIGAQAVFAVTSCTAALHLALLAAGIGPGDEVITPSLTFAAGPNAIIQAGAEVVFADVDATGQLDPAAARAAITSRTSAIMVTHYGGHPADLPTLRHLAGSHHLLLIEDAAAALGATCHGRHIGGTASGTDAAAFSLYANKGATTGEGGLLAGPADLVERARRLGRHGIDSAIWARHGQKNTAAIDVTAPGLKYVMSDINAAIGIHQVAKLPRFITRRTEIADRYTRHLCRHPGCTPPVAATWARPTWWLYPALFADRDHVASALNNAGIGTSMHYRPVHQLTYYRSRYRADLPVTEDFARRELSLPCYPAMTDAEVDRVLAALR